MRYPAAPPSVEEIIAIMGCAGAVVLWRAGLRIGGALALTESDLDPVRGAILIRAGKGGKRREIGMNPWAWKQLQSWLALRQALPIGALFRVVHGPTRGGPCSAPSVRV